MLETGDYMKKPLLVPKRTVENPDYGYGVCLWRLPDGTYIQDAKQNYLCAQAKMNDPQTEMNMLRAARSLGFESGEPFWLSGFRAISDMEWEDQMDTLLSGGIPDLVDKYRQNKYGD